MKDAIPPFEIPEAMRAFTEKSVDQAKKAFDDFVAATHSALTKAESSTSGVQANAFGMQKTMIELAEENVAASFEHVQKLTKVKSMQEMMELQTAFVKARMAALGEQTRVVTEAAQKTAAQMSEATLKP